MQSMKEKMTEKMERSKAFNFSFRDRDRSNSSPPSPSPTPPNEKIHHQSHHETPSGVESPQPTSSRSASRARPQSVVMPMMGGPLIDTNRTKDAEQTLPEMVRIFRYLNAHNQKIFHEGYFQKLNDLNPDGSAVTNRVWTDCYAQLIGTVLSIWDDKALEEQERRQSQGYGPQKDVPPTFINLTDATMKMIGSLPQRAQGGPPLQNVLSISTAGRNRYLLHFTAHHEMTQWTAAIRLAIYENISLQEAYTGALIGAKGPALNNIKDYIVRTRFQVMDWTRVRFGAGTPWRKCWTIISPPDEKAYAKQKKAMKKQSKINVSDFPPLLGDIKFYDTKNVKKKTIPIATVTSAYSCYAIYPESRQLIDQSTLMKIEGNILFHGDTPYTTEGLVFMMPDLHPGVTGFEMLLRFLMPTFDVFNLYGRPTRLAADSIDGRSLMFGFPKENKKIYGYLDLLDVVNVVASESSAQLTEAEWRKKMKELTMKQMLLKAGTTSRRVSVSSQRMPGKSAFGSTVSFDDQASRVSTQSSRPRMPTIPSFGGDNGYIPQTFTPPPVLREDPNNNVMMHKRTLSEARGFSKYAGRGIVPPSESSSPLPTPPIELPAPAVPTHMNSVPPPPTPPHRVLPRMNSYQGAQQQEQSYSYDGQPTYTDGAYAEPLQYDSSVNYNNSVGGHQYTATQQPPALNDSYPAPNLPPLSTTAPPVPYHKQYTSPNRLSSGTMALMLDNASKARDAGAAGYHSNGDFEANQSSSRDIHTGGMGTRTSSEIPYDRGQVEGSGVGARKLQKSQPNTYNEPTSQPRIAAAEGSKLSKRRPISSYSTNSNSASEYSTDTYHHNLHTDNDDVGNDERMRLDSIAASLPQLGRPRTGNSASSYQDGPAPVRTISSTTHPRKPLPVRTKSQVSVKSISSVSSSLQGMRIDEDALNRILEPPMTVNKPTYAPTPAYLTELTRERLLAGEVIGVNDEDDYASTRESADTVRTKTSDDLPPRTGAMKTVGEAKVLTEVKVGEAHYLLGKQSDVNLRTKMPTVDFGVTADLTKMPFSSPVDQAFEKPRTRGYITAEQLAKPSTPSRQAEKGQRHTHEKRRSMAWQPGIVPPQAPQPAEYDFETAEDYVNAQMTQARSKLQHQRTSSFQLLKRRSSERKSPILHSRSASVQNSPNIEHNRTPSQEHLGNYFNSRPQSRNALDSRPQSRNALDSRPQSRNALVGSRPPSRNALNEQPHPLSQNILDSRPQSRNALAPNRRSTSQDHIAYFTNSRPQSGYGIEPPRPSSRNALNGPTSRLTAQEQEYVVRHTGAPLLGQQPGKENRLSQGGLLAEMEARQREKEMMKETRSNFVVQQAVQDQQRRTALHQRSSSQGTLLTMSQMTPAGYYADETQQQGYWQQQQQQQQQHRY